MKTHCKSKPLLLLALGLLLVGGCPGNSKPDPPVIVVSPLELSFGGIAGQGGAITKEFLIHNVGGGELTYIISIDSLCTLPSPAYAPPGKSVICNNTFP